MRSKLRLAASLLAIMALSSIAATAVMAANPHTMYTCTKTKNNGQTDVKTNVPEPAVGGLTNAGYSCVTEAPAGEDEDGDQTTDEGPGSDSAPEQGETTDEGPGSDSAPEQGETTDEGPGSDSALEQDPELRAEEHSSPAVTVEAPSESRSLYCSTGAPGERGNAGGSGVALDLPDSQGALLVEMGLATPGIFYAGIGVSCDILPGFTYSGVWVDHIGDVVPGTAVYPYYVPTTG